MKLMKRFSLAGFIILCNLVVGQTQVNYSANSNYTVPSLESKSLVILYTNKYSITRNVKGRVSKETSVKESLDAIALKAKAYDATVDPSMGTYLNPYTNAMKIVTQDDKTYTNAQLNCKKTGRAVLKQNLKDGRNSLDLTVLEPGRYVLILTDENMGIYAEDITIF